MHDGCKTTIDGVDILDEKPERKPPPLTYVWPGLVFIDFHKMPGKNEVDWNCASIVRTIDGKKVRYNLDTGGRWHLYFEKYPDVKLRDISEPPTKGGRELPYGKLMYDGHFLHYGCGTNWNGSTHRYIEEKNKFVFGVIDDVLKGNK